MHQFIRIMVRHRRREESLAKYGETGVAEPLLRKTQSLFSISVRDFQPGCRHTHYGIWGQSGSWHRAIGWSFFHCNTSDNFHIETADKRRMCLSLGLQWPVQKILLDSLWQTTSVRKWKPQMWFWFLPFLNRVGTQTGPQERRWQIYMRYEGRCPLV